MHVSTSLFGNTQFIFYIRNARGAILCITYNVDFTILFAQRGTFMPYSYNNFDNEDICTVTLHNVLNDLFHWVK